MRLDTIILAAYHRSITDQTKIHTRYHIQTTHALLCRLDRRLDQPASVLCRAATYLDDDKTPYEVTDSARLALTWTGRTCIIRELAVEKVGRKRRQTVQRGKKHDLPEHDVSYPASPRTPQPAVQQEDQLHAPYSYHIPVVPCLLYSDPPLPFTAALAA